MAPSRLHEFRIFRVVTLRLPHKREGGRRRLQQAKTPPGCDGVSGFSLCLPGRRQALYQEPVCISLRSVLLKFLIFGGCAYVRLLPRIL